MGLNIKKYVSNPKRIWDNVERIAEDVGKSATETIQGAVVGFMVGGPVGAVIGAGAGMASGIRADKMKEAARTSIDEANKAIANGISSTIAMEKLFTELQIQNLTEVYDQTEDQIRERLRTEPEFIVDAYKQLEDTLDPEIIARYSDSMSSLEDVLKNGSADTINAINEGFQNANNQMTEADRLIISSFDSSTETLEDGLTRLQYKYGNINDILAGVSEQSRDLISENSAIAKQAYESGAVDASKTLGAGSDEAIRTLEKGREQQIQTGQTGLREALGQGQAYAQKGTEGLGAFADTALNPDSALFKRNLAEAQESLNQQLASRGLLDSGAAIEAQSKLIQDMTQEEMQRQTGLQKDLANMGLGQVAQQQGLIADQTRNEINAIAQEAGLRAGIQQSTAQQQAQLQSQLGRDLAQLSTLSTEQKVNMLKDMGVLQANYQAQSAQDIMEIDKALATTAIQEGVARGQISQQQASNLINQGLQTGNVLSSLSTNLSNLGQTTATTVANQEMLQNQQELGLQQEGLRGALSMRDRLQTQEQGLPLQEFQDQYNITRPSQTNLQNLEMGQANARQQALLAGAQRNMQQSNDATSNFNTLLSLAGTFGGGGAGGSTGGGGGFFQALTNAGQQGGTGGVFDFAKGMFTQGQRANTNIPMTPSESGVNLPSSSGLPSNLSNFGVTPYNPSSASMPSMISSTPTSNSFFNPSGPGPGELNTSFGVQPLSTGGGRGKAGFAQAMPQQQQMPSDTGKFVNGRGTGFSLQQQLANTKNPYTGNQMPRVNNTQGFRNQLRRY